MNFIWFVDYRKSTTLFDFSKEKKNAYNSEANVDDATLWTPDVDIPNLKILKTKSFLIEINELDTSSMKWSGIASTNMGLPC